MSSLSCRRSALLQTVLRSITVAALALTLSTAHAIDYNEDEANNNSFPPSFLPGNPTFLSGDRLLGSLSTADDTDDQYITFAGAGAPGLYRYTFDLVTGGSDSALDIYDASANGFFLGRSDDFPATQPASRVIFDQFQATTASTVFGVGIFGFDAFDYALTITRTSTPITALGTLGNGMTTRTNPTPAGAGTWYSFTLANAATVTFDTFGSLNNDTEIAIFDAAGNTIGGNDDDPGGSGLLSEVGLALTGGNYFVAVGPFNSRYNWNETTGAPAGWDRNGFSAGGDAFNDGNNLLSHTVNITVVPSAAETPEPGTLLLVLPAFCTAAGVRVIRRRRRATQA